MGYYVGKSSSTDKAVVAPSGPTGPVHVLLGNPNTTSVTGTLYLQDGTTDSVFLLKFTIDGNVPTVIELGKPLAEGQRLYLTLDAAPTSQITIWSTW